MYPTHSIKQDPLTNAVAVRTVFPVDGEKAWWVFDLAGKAHYVFTDAVAEWTDMVAVTPSE